MKIDFQKIADATRLVRSGELRAATALIQAALSGREGSDAPPASQPARAPEDVIDVPARVVAEAEAARVESQVAPEAVAPESVATPEPVREAPSRAATAHAVGPDRFIPGSFANGHDRRDYMLFVPPQAADRPLPLVVMLHGCMQDPDDFAAGTKMNELAEKQHCFVLYPAQTSAANGWKCWNWFKATDQQRDQGEPSIIAGMTRQVCDAYAVDARRIYVAGLSAGGAMAVTMALAYPELYAAVGIHSGLPHAVARDLPSALATMQQGRVSPIGGAAEVISGSRPVAAIAFHGDRDTTVHPGNGDQVIAQCMPPSAPQRAQAAPDPRVTVQHGQVPQGYAYTRTLYHQIDGQSIAEHWLIHGAGHVWSGGSARGSYTDPKGPDAAEHMLRFFLEHPRSEAAA